MNLSSRKKSPYRKEVTDFPNCWKEFIVSNRGAYAANISFYLAHFCSSRSVYSKRRISLLKKEHYVLQNKEDENAFLDKDESSQELAAPSDESTQM